MRVALFAADDFSIPICRFLAESGKFACLVTQPDRQRGRGRKISSLPVKDEACCYDIPVLTAEKLTDENFINEFKSFNIDIFKKRGRDPGETPSRKPADVPSRDVPSYGEPAFDEPGFDEPGYDDVYFEDSPLDIDDTGIYDPPPEEEVPPVSADIEIGPEGAYTAPETLDEYLAETGDKPFLEIE